MREGKGNVGKTPKRARIEVQEAARRRKDSKGVWKGYLFGPTVIASRRHDRAIMWEEAAGSSVYSRA